MIVIYDIIIIQMKYRYIKTRAFIVIQLPSGIWVRKNI